MLWANPKLQLKRCFVWKKTLRIETQNVNANREDLYKQWLSEGESIKETSYVKVKTQH